MKLSVTDTVRDFQLDAFVLRASGGSMIPTIVKGDKIHFVKNSSHLKIADIILFKDIHGTFIIHRVTQVIPELKTKGDANTQFDAPAKEVVGKVIYIEKTWRSRLRRFTLMMRGIFGHAIRTIARMGS